MKIKIETYLMKKGNRVGKAAVEFESTDGFMAGFHLVGFTICEDDEKKLFVLFPSSRIKTDKEERNFFFLRPQNENRLDELEDLIISAYLNATRPFNNVSLVD